MDYYHLYPMKNWRTKMMSGFIDIVMILLILKRIYFYVSHSAEPFCINSGFRITEFLINYQGGYVRRGLLGSILYWLSTNFNIEISFLIGAIIWVSLIVAFILFLKIVHGLKLKWWIIPLSFTFFNGEDWIRKDYLCLIIIAAIIWLISRENLNKWGKYAGIVILCVLLWNLHEAFFFVIGPFATYYILFKDRSFSYVGRVLFLIPIYAAFLAVLVFHGTTETAITIQESWHNIYPEYIPLITADDCVVRWGGTNNSITALGWGALDTLKFHIGCIYGGDGAGRIPQPYGIFVMPFIYLLLFYFLSRFTYLFTSKGSVLYGASNNSFSIILLFQFISLFPLFGFLSCDIRRICIYWALSSWMILYFFGQERIETLFPKKIMLIGNRANNWIDHLIKNPKGLLICMILFLGVPVDKFHVGTIIRTTAAGEIMFTVLNRIIIPFTSLFC